MSTICGFLSAASMVLAIGFGGTLDYPGRSLVAIAGVLAMAGLFALGMWWEYR